jgi:hypothetical protein
MSPFHELVRDALPRLTADNYRITSAATWEYNCIAWAVGVTDAWWWPLPGRYWPAEVPREETIAAFLAVFALHGYQPIDGDDLERGVEKLALYAQDDTPTHAARQLADGWWTRKLGPSIDIEHATPDAVAGGEYGEVIAVLGRTTVALVDSPTPS